jgi:hypothetical protein
VGRVLGRLLAGLASEPDRFGVEPATWIAQALLLDFLASGATADDASALPDARIVEAGVAIWEAMLGTAGSFELPFGTAASEGRPGSVDIGGRAFVARTWVPGLQPIEIVPRHVHGPNLERLRRDVFNRHSPTSERIGLPSPALVCDGGVVRHLLEFPPLPEAGGVVLRIDVEDLDAARFCAAPALQLERFAGLLMRRAQWLWRARARIGRRVAAVREAALAGVEAARGRAESVEFDRICVDGRSADRKGEPTLVVEYLGLDDALRRTRLADVVGADDGVAQRLLRAPSAHARRTESLRLLTARGADGWIDFEAAAIVRAAPEGERAVLARLAREFETVVELPGSGRPAHATLYWREGVIRAEAAGAGAFEMWGQGLETRDRSSPGPGEPRLARFADRPSVLDGHRWPRVSRPEALRPSKDEAALLVSTAAGLIWDGDA